MLILPPTFKLIDTLFNNFSHTSPNWIKHLKPKIQEDKDNKQTPLFKI